MMCGKKLGVKVGIGILWNTIDGQIFGLFTKIFVPPKSTVGFVLNLNQF
jgi:hypothetical protein